MSEKMESGNELASEDAISKHERELDGIALRVSEMPEFQKIIEIAQNKSEAYHKVMEALKTSLPEIEELPDRNKVHRHVGGYPGGRSSNYSAIAKLVLELLWHK